MSTLPAQKSVAPAKPTLTKPVAKKAATTKSASLSPSKATVNLPVRAPLSSKPVVTNKPAVSSKPIINGASKPATNTTLKIAVQLKPKLSNGKKNNGHKDNGQNKKNDHKDDKKSDKKDDKKMKTEKVKMERDSFTMPKDEYAQLALLKSRLNAIGQPAKKSELLRAGIKLLAVMSDLA